MAIQSVPLRPMSFDVFNLPVYPDADLLPMLDGEEMEELITSVRENGLRQPIVIAPCPNGDGEVEMMLIDGRNRREACKRVGIDPPYIQFDGDIDAIKTFILDSDTRRHNTKGQRAMRVALMFPKTEQGKRTTSLKIKEVNIGLLSQARTVLAYASDLTSRVLAGAVSLNDAYQQAQERKKAAESETSRLAELQANAPDLAELVKEGLLQLSEALASWQQRKKEAEIIAKNQRDSLFRSLSESIYGPSYFCDLETAEKVHDLLVNNGDLYKLEWSSKFAGDWKSQLARLRRAQRGLENLLSVFSKVMPDEESYDE